MLGGPALRRLVEAFSRLPGIGRKTAERLSYYLILQPEQSIREFGTAILELKKGITECENCQTVTDTSPCQLCRQKTRQKNIICLVSGPQDITALEKADAFNGLYYVVGGTVNPLEGLHLQNLKLQKLTQKILSHSLTEIILGFNPDLSGESTSLALVKYCRTLAPHLKITRLARGLPMGSDLEYADEVTLKNALKGRHEV